MYKLEKTEPFSGVQLEMEGRKFYWRAIDISEVKAFASEVYALIRKYKYKYRVFTFTAGLANEVDIRKLKAGTIEITDRGGTSIEDALYDVLKDNRPPDIFIVFTDLYDDVPTPDDFGSKEVIYALTPNHNQDQVSKLKKFRYKYFVLR